MRFSNLTSFLVRRADDTVMFIHPTFREWLYKRRDSESQKFVCDPRNGHAAIALRMSRIEAPLNPDRTLDLGHHILKAHLYKSIVSSSSTSSIPPRDLQAIWVALSTEDLSLALGSVRNVASPNTKVSRLLLLAGMHKMKDIFFVQFSFDNHFLLLHRSFSRRSFGLLRPISTHGCLCQSRICRHG